MPGRTPREKIGDESVLTGTVEQISFRNDETGYVICSVTPDDREGGMVKVVGTCAAIWVGEELTATGRWENDARFGLQFRAESMVCVAPTSTEGVRRFLSGGLIKGIGPVHASRIVDRFGSDTLQIIENSPRRLMEVEGIGRQRCRTISESWSSLKGVRDVMIFLQSHGVGMGQATRIYRAYGTQAIAVVKQNPYRLCREVFGFGFLTADSIAMKLGIEKDAPQRAQSGLLHVLEKLEEEGHCFCEEPALLLTAQAMLDIPVEKLAEALAAIVESGMAVRDGQRIYLRGLHEAECNVARRLLAIAESSPPYREIDADRALAWAEARMRLVLAGAQRRAIATAVGSKASVITGGPGVGKTTIIRALVEIFGVRKLKIRLAAPTGRAAKRMSEATGCEALTIHRLLKYLPPKRAFAHDETNPIDADVLIVDESSMIDIVLMDQLLRALPDRITLILVGDTDQLPSVGPGNVLRDIIASGAIPCNRLDTIFRQDTRGMIVRNAHHINAGEEMEAGGSDFFFIETQDPGMVVSRVCDLVTTRIPGKFHIPPADIQVLTPMRKNQLGADNLNVVLQQAVNPSGPGLKRGLTVFRRGDRVMQMRNNYDKEVFNGDVGFVNGIDAEGELLKVDFDGRTVSYERGELDELVLAYASTVHKSQGSEYPAVVIVLATQHFKLLQRNLLYTAVTRGRKLVCIVGSHKAAAIATRNNEVRQRQTALAERLRSAV